MKSQNFFETRMTIKPVKHLLFIKMK